MKNYKKYLELQKQRYADGGDVNPNPELTSSNNSSKQDIIDQHHQLIEQKKALAREFEKRGQKLDALNQREDIVNTLERIPNDEYNFGGQVQESQQKQYQAKDYFGKGSNGAGEGVANSMGVAMTMSEGGDVPDDQQAGSSLGQFLKSLRDAWKAPLPPAPHPETQDERFARIRQENTERMSGSRSPFMDGKAYSEGGDVEQDDKDKSSEQKIGENLTRNLDPDKVAQFHPFSDGGDVRKSMAQRIASPIQKIDATTGQVIQEIPKVYRSSQDDNQQPNIQQNINQDLQNDPLRQYLKMRGTVSQQQPENKTIDDLAKDKLQRYLDLVNKTQEKGYDTGGIVGGPAPVSPMNASANTASSLSPLLKESYAGPQKKKPVKLSTGGWAPEQLPKLPKIQGVHSPVEKKYPINIPKAPRITIPKRLKPVGDIRGYDTGGDVQDNQMDLGDVSPIQVEGLPYDYNAEEQEAGKDADFSNQEQLRKELEDENNQKEVPAETKVASKAKTTPHSPNQVDLEGDTLSSDDPRAQLTPDEKETANKEDADQEIDKDFKEQTDQEKENKDLEDTYSQEEKDAETKADEEETPSEEPSPKAVKEQPFNAMQAMKEAQDYRNKSQMWNQLGAIAERGAAAYARIPTTQQEAYKENMAIAQQAVDDTKTRIAMQGYDPNSQTSKMFRQYLEKFSGQPVDPSTTAMDGKEILPIVFKDFEAKQAEATRQAMATERTQERLQGAQIAAEARTQAAQTAADQRAQAAKDSNDLMKLLGEQKVEAEKTKKEQQDIDKKDKLAAQTGQLLEQMRGSPAAGQAERDLYNAQKADSLANLYKDPNQMSPQQVRLLATEVSKIASGGAPTMEELKTVDPSSLRRDLAGVIQKLTNSPSPANAADFVKQFKDYTHALSKDSQKVITDRYNRIIEPRKKQLGDEHYNNLKDLYLNRFETPEQTSSSSSTTGKTVVRKGYNSKTDQTQLIYNDGTSEIKPGKL